MNETTADSSGTTSKTTRKRTARSRKKVAPKEIAMGAVPAPSSRTAPPSAPQKPVERKDEAPRNTKPADQTSEAPAEKPSTNRSSDGSSSGSDGKKTRRKRSRSKSPSSKSSASPDSSPRVEADESAERAPSSKRGVSRMLINYIPGDECRVALTVDGILEEFHSERAGNLNIVGNIYVGKVMNVERSIQAAFVDFGYGVNGFLHISDLHPQYFPGEDENTTEKIGMKTPRRERPPIERCLKRGQKILVQVLKEGISTKGPTLTSYLSIPGRFLVMLPDMDKVGVSRKVEDEDQRRTMRKILDSLDLPKEFGFILRTAGMNQTKAELKRDLAYLQRLWKDIDKRLSQGDKPRLLYAESDLLMRALRDIWTSDIDEIIVDDPSAIRRAYAFMRIVSPRSSTKLLAYDRQVPLFHAFGVEEQIERILAREVPLPSGGSLVIDEAEAMVAIDVNSGKSRNHGDAETMAYRINQEAIEEICRQIKLRDVGGLIMCDLIDMMKRSHRHDIEKRMEDLLKKDRASTRALPISEFGIMEMTRQRVRGSMKSVHFAKLDIGDGRGWVRRPDSVATNAMRDLAALMQHERVAKVEMVVSPRVAGELLSSKRQALTRLELKLHKRVDVRVSESIAVDRVVMYAYDESGSDIEVERLAKFRPPTDLSEYKPENAEEQDWAVDATAEHQQDLEELVHEEAVKLDEVLAMEASLLSDDEDDDEDGGSESSSDSSGGGRKRRRRRRRRRGGGGEDADNRADDARNADSRPQDNRSAEHDSDDDEDDEHDEPRAEQSSRQPSDEQDADGQPRKRRRRRRRRRGGGGGEGADGEHRSESGEESSGEPRAKAQDHARENGRDHNTSDRGRVQLEAKAPKREGLAPSGFPWRGDSWDIEPSALTMAEGGGFKNPADAKLAAEIKAGKDPQQAAAAESSNRSEPANRSDSDGDGDGDGDDNGSGGGGGRKRRRRRGGRSGDSADSGAPAGSGREPAKASADVDPPEPKPSASTKPASPAAPSRPAPTPDAERQTGRRTVGTRKGPKKAPADILIAGAVKPISKPVSKSDSSKDSKPASKPTTNKKSTTKKATTKKTTKASTAKKTTKKSTAKKPTTKKASTRKKTTKKTSS